MEKQIFIKRFFLIFLIHSLTIIISYEFNKNLHIPIKIFFGYPNLILMDKNYPISIHFHFPLK